ncbi:hypothetical protein [Actinoplanes sp. NPDC051859]|uniref:hypothetical protein n=1 Tax=Actinoplanes sp. NPDC051859 TaxID=3363909 RepID=UPI0037B3F378
MTPKNRRPSLSANPEPIVTAAAGTTAAAAGPTSTLSLRVPTDLYETVQKEIRRLHYEQGAAKGAIATALLTTALAHMDEVHAHLSVK